MQISEEFVKNQEENARLCEAMATAEDLDSVFERYQKLLDLFQAMDGDNYESNIHKQLFVAGMTDLAETQVSQISGGSRTSVGGYVEPEPEDDKDDDSAISEDDFNEIIKMLNMNKNGQKRN